MTHSATMLSITGVTRRFGRVAALTDIDLDIGHGQIVCLVGHSGCGKSTLLRVIAGIEEIDAGVVVLDGEIASGGDVFVEPQNRHVGLMFQDYALFPHLTSRQNIAFGLSRLRRNDAARRVAEIIALLGIETLADRYPHMLSGGEQQRIALARALAPRPKVLLMDEPFSNLDRGLRDQVRSHTVALLRQLGTTAIVVTHDPEEALAIGDRIVLMRHGRIVENSTGAAIYEKPETPYAAAFFSQINTLPGRRDGDRIVSAIGTFPIEEAISGDVVLYIRPRAIRVGDHGVAAVVRNHVCLGEIEEWTFEIAGHAPPVVMRTSDRHDLRIGDQTRLSVRRSDVRMFDTALDFS